jgi:ATP-dependent RNA helicase DDX27
MALLARTFAGKRAIVFARTKARAHRLKVLAGLCDMTAAELHGDMTQAQRLASLELFRTGGAQVLIATDVAARGLDIAAVAAVISLDAPRDVSSYLHRCGRTARAGAAGTAVTLAEEKDRPLLKALAAATRAAKGDPSQPRAQLRERQVDAAAVAVWRARLESLADAVAHVASLEAEEAMGRRADMEASKAEHLLEHAEEIAARPARSWFQSEREKERVVKTAKAAALAVGAPAPKLKGRKRKGEPAGEGSAKKAKQGDGPEMEEAEGRAKPQDDAAAARRGAAMAKGAAKRALVAGARPKAAADAAKAALQKDMLARRKLMRRTEQAVGQERPAKSAGPGGLFAGDGINGARPGAGDRGKDDRHLREAKAGLAARLAARAERPQRGGDKVKRSGFKSKARYKRK